MSTQTKRTQKEPPTEKHDLTRCTYTGQYAQKARYSKPPKERNICYNTFQCPVCGKKTKSLRNTSKIGVNLYCNGRKFSLIKDAP